MIDNSNIDYPLQIAVLTLLILKNIHSRNYFILYKKAASYVLYNTQYMNALKLNTVLDVWYLDVKRFSKRLGHVLFYLLHAPFLYPNKENFFV